MSQTHRNSQANLISALLLLYSLWRLALALSRNFPSWIEPHGFNQSNHAIFLMPSHSRAGISFHYESDLGKCPSKSRPRTWNPGGPRSGLSRFVPTPKSLGGCHPCNVRITRHRRNRPLYKECSLGGIASAPIG